MKIAFIGAGTVNFGGAEGPWDHATRFERIPGVSCVGVADLDVALAERQIATRRAGPHGSTYSEAAAFADWEAMVNATHPDAVVVGLPPEAHGRAHGAAAIETALAARGVPMLVEKPLSLAPPDEVAAVRDACATVVCSVGYMFRYSAAVLRMKAILDATPGGPRVFVARYDTAYSELDRSMWWDVRRSGGPIIEQATHFVDLARFLCGEVDHDTIQVTRIRANEPRGALSDLPRPGGAPIDDGVPDEHRIDRATLAQWRFTSGAVGQLAHGIFLHNKRYEAELEVWADGVRLVLADPYGHCRLGVRMAGENDPEWIDFADDDPYMTEDRAFADAVVSRDTRGIASPFADAFETYRLTWAIAHKS